MFPSRRISMLLLLLLLLSSSTALAQSPEPAHTPAPERTEPLRVSGISNFPPSVYVFAQSSSSYGIYYLEGNRTQQVASIPVSAATVDHVSAKLSPDHGQVAYLLTDGESDNTALYITTRSGATTRLIYSSPDPALGVTSFAWRGNEQLVYTLARGPFAAQASGGQATNVQERAAAAPYSGEVWVSTVDGKSQTQVVSQTAGVVLGSLGPDQPIYYTVVNTDTRVIEGLNRVLADGRVEVLFRNELNAQGRGTVYYGFDLVQTAPGVTRLALFTVDGFAQTMPTNGTTLHTANLDGQDVQTVLHDPYDIARAAWSPDGQKVAYVRGSTGVATVHNLAQGTDITLPNQVQDRIQWTLDGKLAAPPALNERTPFTKGLVVQSLDGEVTAEVETQANANTSFNSYLVPGYQAPGYEPYVHQRLGTPSSFTGKNEACGSTSVVMSLAYLGKLNAPYMVAYLGQHLITVEQGTGAVLQARGAHRDNLCSG